MQLSQPAPHYTINAFVGTKMYFTFPTPSSHALFPAGLEVVAVREVQGDFCSDWIIS